AALFLLLALRARAAVPADAHTIENCVEAISQSHKKPDAISHVGLFSAYYCRQRPTLPHSFPCSTIGGSRLNFRVRNGNGCDPAPVPTGILGAWGFGFRGATHQRHIARNPNRPMRSFKERFDNSIFCKRLLDQT